MCHANRNLIFYKKLYIVTLYKPIVENIFSRVTCWLFSHISTKHCKIMPSQRSSLCLTGQSFLVSNFFLRFNSSHLQGVRKLKTISLLAKSTFCYSKKVNCIKLHKAFDFKLQKIGLNVLDLLVRP